MLDCLDACEVMKKLGLTEPFAFGLPADSQKTIGATFRGRRIEVARSALSYEKALEAVVMAMLVIALQEVVDNVR